MKIALAQINPIIGNFEYNFNKITEFANKAKSLSADIVVFPELAVSGYPPKDFLEKQAFITQNLNTFKRLVKSIKGIGVVCGYADTNHIKEEKSLFNAAALFENGKIIHKAYKRLLPSYDVFDETRYFEEGKTSEAFLYKGEKIGLTICEDFWNDKSVISDRYYKNDPVADIAEDGAKIIINISASPFEAKKNNFRASLISSAARNNEATFIYVNQAGANDSLIFDGLSAVSDSRGNFCAIAKEFEEDIIIYDSSPSENYNPIFLNFAHENESILDALIIGTKDYIIKSGFSKAAIGLSGGIDSALTAAIAVEALGAENVTGVFMPSLYTSKENYQDTSALAENLNIKLEVIPIDKIYKEFLNGLFFTSKSDKPDITEQNIQARIRGTILMAYSNKTGALVLTTGNKSELAVGYCTLYGDMAGALAVIADVPKTTVYELSYIINKERPKIPFNIIRKAPSAELAPMQKDEDELPPYKILDAVLKGFIEEDKDVNSLIKEGFDKGLVQDIIRRISKNEYKRHQSPLGLKVTSKAFGYGRRYPIACDAGFDL
ncbi:MAG: NAD+ synthase [Deltaproteobacteria bacterium]|nr:NAD+ synthase [Deltaproteobacteria bacterium]